MIKYNNSNIDNWNFGDANIIKIYSNGVVAYYKWVEGSTAQTPCYAVVNDISQYTDTEFVDVYDKATSKWYKLNNLGNFEVYGVYADGTGSTVTTYDGKLAVVDGYEYQYTNGAWINVGETSETTASLPDVPFTLNYNAKVYNAATHSIPYTDGALNQIDAVITGSTSGIIDHSSNGYIELTGSTTIRANIGTANFSRDGSNPNITIICKAYTPGNTTEGNILTNRNQSYNWMYRHKSNILTFHGTSEQGSISVSNTEPNTCSIRVNSNRLLTYNNWTQNTTTSYSNFAYGSYSDGGALFAGYYSSSSEMWKGVFYWIYMSLNTLTDEQVQQVIAYNEEGSTIVYPIYYDEKQDPPTTLTFNTMEEALAYQCPYVGVIAIIGGRMYKFNANYEWEELSYTITGVTTSSSDFTIKLNNVNTTCTVFSDNGDGTYNWGVMYTQPITNTTQMCDGNSSLKQFDWGDADLSSLTSIGQYAFSNCSNLSTDYTDLIPNGITSIGNYAFHYCSNIAVEGGTTLEIPNGVTSIGVNAFFNNFSNFGQGTITNSVTIPSTLRTINTNAFNGCTYLYYTDITDLSSWFNVTLDAQTSCPWYSAYSKNIRINGNTLTNLTIPSDVTTLKSYTFANYTTLTGLTIPSTVTAIDGEYTFYNTRIRELTVPSSVTSWNGRYTFSLNTSLSSVTLNNNSSVPNYAFSGCTNLREATINLNGLNRSLFNNVFFGCNSLSSVTMNSSVGYISDFSFSGCTNLKSITIDRTTPPVIYTNTFHGTPSDLKFYVPCSAVNTYRTANDWSNYASQIVGFESCTTYDWQVVSGEYVCAKGNKYAKEQKIASFDGGETWEAVTPAEYRRGSLIEEGSEDCSGYSHKYFTLATDDGSNANFYVPIIGNKTIDYSIDNGQTWATAVGASQIYQISTPSIMLRAVTSLPWASSQGTNYAITASTRFHVEGNIMSLFYGDDFENQTTLNISHACESMFNSSTNLTSAENLVLPARTIGTYAYHAMFYKCRNLTNAAPIIEADEIPAEAMSLIFEETNITSVNLPNATATTANAAIYAAFNSCTQLKEVNMPSMVNYASQYYTFRNNTSLEKIVNNATNGTNFQYYNSISQNVTFYKNPNATWTGLPSTWTVVDIT